MKIEVNITIIGGGVIGLSVAAELCKTEKDIFLIEKNESFGMETSARNSEVIHAGIYYPENSLKAKLCVKGNRYLYDICESKKIPFLKCGKIIAATSKEEEKKLYNIKELAEKNGVYDISFLSEKQIKEYEPQVKAVSALYSHSTGIIDSYKFMRFLKAEAQKNKVNFLFKTKVLRVEKLREGKYKVYITYPDGEKFSFISNKIINCAGLESDKIAASMGINITACNYKQYFWKGEYFSLNVKKDFIKRLIYPVPLANNAGLGIHATIDLKGRVRLGPNAIYLVDKDYDFTVNKSHKQNFFEAAKRYLPDIRYEDLEPEMAGIRPKLQKPEDKVRDFIINEESEKGLPNIVNLIGIESPGLTSSLAIAEYVKKLLNTL